MASTYLIRSTPSETFSKLTVSCWLKGMADGTQRNFWGLYDNSDNTRFFGLYYSSNGSLYAYWKQGGEGVQFTLGTTQKFRDPSAWYHFVMTMDTTLATASDRVKFYVNGERVTSFEDSLDTITQSKTCNMMNGTTDGRMQWGGGKISGTQNYWNGLMSHCHMCVGYAYDASSFGSTDSVTGEWKINTSPSVSYGTNGGFWLKDGSQLTDSSSNSNTLTVGGGTLTNTEDCPSNVFATLNPLIAQTGANFLNGNNNCHRTSAGNYRRIGCTLGATSGKYYAEFLLGASQWGGVCLTNGGDIKRTEYGTAGYMGEYSADKSVGIRQDGIVYSSGANVSSAQWNLGTISGSDRLCLALDMDNKKLFLGKNGTWSSSSNPATNTGGITLTGDSYTFCVATSNADCIINTGNGNFANGTTANLISSEGTNASGIGKFEYDVPNGFTALSTKGLNL